jgi:hypothetical protein
MSVRRHSSPATPGVRGEFGRRCRPGARAAEATANNGWAAEERRGAATVGAPVAAAGALSAGAYLRTGIVFGG